MRQGEFTLQWGIMWQSSGSFDDHLGCENCAGHGNRSAGDDADYDMSNFGC